MSSKYSGWNSGNEVWEMGARLMLEPSTKISKLSQDVVHYNADTNILAPQNLFPENIYKERISRFNKSKNVISMGMGIQLSMESDPTVGKLSDIQISMLKVLESKTTNVFGLRGTIAQSFAFRSNVTKGIATGCPSLYLNEMPCLGKHLRMKFSKLPKRARDAKIAFALNANPKSDFNQIVRNYINTTETSQIIMQMPTDVGSSGLPIHSKILVDFKDIESWKKHLQSFDVLISGRIHGGMMGIYAGIPTIVVSDDYRIRELTEKMFIPSFKNNLKNRDIEHIYNNVIFNPYAFDDNRAMTLDIYEQMFVSNGLKMHPRLQKIRKKCDTFFETDEFNL